MHKKSHNVLNYAMHTWKTSSKQKRNPNDFNISYFRNLKSFFTNGFTFMQLITWTLV